MEFRILGPFEVRDEGRELPLGGAKQRALLAVLLLHANEVVSADRLIDELWGEQPPATAAKVVQVYVSQLRKALEGRRGRGRAEGVLQTRAPGYVLRVEPGQLDADRFARLVDEGRQALAAGTPALAARKLLEGLALWRGPALADFTFDSFAQREIARLEELRVTALEERIEADLALGRHAELAGEVEALVAQYPHRERLRGQLMLALYRSGRQAEALEAYREARRALVEELGLEPGPALQHLERGILSQDDALAPPARAERELEPAAEGEIAARALRRTRPRAFVLGAIVLVLAAALASALLVRGNGVRPLQAVPVDSVGVIDAGTGRIVAAVPVGARPTAVAFGEGSTWVTSFNGRTLSRVDPEKREVTRTVGTGAIPSAVAAGEGAVWVTNEFAGTVSRIDTDSNAIVETIRVGNGPSAVAVGAGAVWIANRVDGTVSRLDPTTGAVRTISVGSEPSAIAVGAGGVWVANSLEASVTRIDPSTGRVVERAIGLRFAPTGLAVGAGGVWVTGTLADAVSRIDPATNAVAATIATGDGPTGVAVGTGSVWVADSTGGSLTQIGPKTNVVVGTVEVGASPDGIIVTGDTVWVTVHAP